MRLAWVVLVAACVKPTLLECPDSGLLCVPGDVCDTIHHLCITPEQQVPCVGMPDESVCAVAGVSGYCRDQICLLPVCGNHYIDHGEACDDGNAVSGDGCNALCTSTEQCGNGFLDPGEACDDGDRISGDGCDSQCHPETFGWETIGIMPRYETGNHHAVYDPVRQQLVLVADDITWTWDGAVWKVLAIGGIPGDTLQAGWSWHQLVWDDDRKTVILVGTISGGVPEAWEWNGVTWTKFDAPVSFPINQATAAYDSATKQVIVVGTYLVSTEAFSFDPSTATWSGLATMPTVSIDSQYGAGIAYDQARHVAVLGAGQNGYTAMTEWNGSTWSAPINALLPYNSQFTLVWDPAVGGVIAVGGRVNPGTVSGQVETWTGTAWTARPAREQLTAPKAQPEVVIEGTTRIVWGGSTGTIETSSLYQFDLGNGWSGPLASYPPEFPQVGQDYVYTYDTTQQRILELGGPSETDTTELWSWNGTWTLLDPCPLSASFYPSPPPIGYDPTRDALVTAAPDTKTYLYHAGAWTALGGPATAQSKTVAITFDPVLHGMVAIDQGATWLLPSTGTQWTRIADVPANGAYPSIAFDARTGQIVYVDASNAYVLVTDHWERTLSPGPSYVVAANARRGSVELFTPGGANYERFAGEFSTESTPPPVAMDGVSPLAAIPAPASGAVMLLGGLRYSRLIVRRTASSTLDKCMGGDDDADGLVDCDDPDCWWSCTPACPPHTSC